MTLLTTSALTLVIQARVLPDLGGGGGGDMPLLDPGIGHEPVPHPVTMACVVVAVMVYGIPWLLDRMPARSADRAAAIAASRAGQDEDQGRP